MKGHYVIAGWNGKGSEIIKQLLGEEGDHKHIVILAPEQASDLPHQAKLLHIERGDRTNEDDLKRVGIQAAHSVILLANSTDPSEDAGTILAILAIRKICSKEDSATQVPVTAEIIDIKNIDLANYAGAAQGGTLEVVSYQEVGKGLLTQAAVNPGLSKVYRKLLELKRNNSEIHRSRVPDQLTGKSFDYLIRLASQHRSQGVHILPIAVQREGEVYINPSSKELSQPLKKDDVLFAICDSPRDFDALYAALDERSSL